MTTPRKKKRQTQADYLSLTVGERNHLKAIKDAIDEALVQSEKNPSAALHQLQWAEDELRRITRRQTWSIIE